MKKTIALLLLTVLLFCFTACGDGISLNEADALLAETIHLIRAGQYTAAIQNFHPTARAVLGYSQTDPLAVYVTSLQNQGVDLTLATAQVKVTGFRTSYYQSTYGGASCELTYSIQFGDTTVTLSATVVRNKEGFGIYRFAIQKNGALSIPFL